MRMEVSMHKRLHVVQEKYSREKRMRKAGWLMALSLPIAVPKAAAAAFAGWRPADWGGVTAPAPA